MSKQSDVTPEPFEQFLERRTEVAASYVNGDSGPLDEILTHVGAATFLSPRGDTVEGADEVAARYRKDAKSFQSGGTNRLEILQSAASDDVAFWTGYQIAEARMPGKQELVPMKLRVTEAFRREDGEWKLVHRHAEPAKDPA